MSDRSSEAEKAEKWQSIKALLIPFSLFIACVISAAGSFLIYNKESLGWIFLVIAAIIIVADFVGLVRFQNKYRAKGILPSQEESE